MVNSLIVYSFKILLHKIYKAERFRLKREAPEDNFRKLMKFISLSFSRSVPSLISEIVMIFIRATFYSFRNQNKSRLLYTWIKQRIVIMQKGTTHKKQSKKKIGQSISEYWADVRKYHPDYYRELCEKNKKNANTNKNNE